MKKLVTDRILSLCCITKIAVEYGKGSHFMQQFEKGEDSLAKKQELWK